MRSLVIVTLLVLSPMTRASTGHEHARPLERQLMCAELLRAGIVNSVAEAWSCGTSLPMGRQHSSGATVLSVEIEREDGPLINCTLSFSGSPLWPRIEAPISCEWIGPC